METEELTKLVDGIYKNILDKFNPGARQMITAGKAYLKALHGAAAASRLYVEAITKLGRQAQQGTWGGSADIGTALMKVVEVYREIQDQQMNILKAFYVDLLVPLETNLEKDTKVVQSEQKRFLQQHKLRSESYSKAAAAMKRQRKKNTKSTKTSGLAMDKELKNMQILEEEKTKLDAFCEQSLKNAMTQERRRYGFVLERQCSLARHWLAYHAAGSAAYRSALDDWQEAARSREGLPPAVDAMFISKMRQVSFWADEDVYASPRAGGAASADELERLSVTSQLRKTRSMDASCLDVRSLDRAASPGGQPLSRAKSDFNISSSTHSLEDESLNATPTRRPRSMALPLNSSLLGASSAEPQMARALYAYLSSGDNQLSFLEGDVLALAGERTKGWQYGENVRTQLTGWFPLAYTEPMQEDVVSSPNRWGCPPVPLAVPRSPAPGSPGASSARSGGTLPPSQSTSTPVTSNGSAMAPRMFGDTLIAHRNSKQLRLATASTSGRAGPPPSLPAPVPAPTVPAATPAGHAQSANRMTQSHSATFHTQAPQQSSTPQGSAPGKASTMKTSTSSSATTGLSDVARVPQTLPARGTSGAMAGVQGSNPGQMKAGQAPVLPPAGNVSLHSSNDSGFSNEPPPQPEIDYSDEENATRHRIPIRNGQRRYEAQTNGHHTHSLQRDHNNVRSMGNENGYGNERYLTDDQQIMLRTMMETDRDGQKIKRTKSFWKFGKSASEDILEGMALWRHRDLVDIVPQYKRRPQENEMINMQKEYRVQRPSNAESNENTLKRNMAKMSIGDKTLDRFEKHGIQKSKSTSSIMNHVENNKVEKKPQNKLVQKPIEVTQSKMQKQTAQQRMEEEYNSRNDRQSNNSDLTNSSTIKTNFENSFYDDENGEGLVVKTVKRKEILQQYDNESVSGSETERASIASSTDPYDCIIVDDHMALRKQRELENRRLQAQQQAQYNTNESSKKSRDKMMYASEISDSDNNGPIKPHLRATLSSERQKTSSKQQQQQANEQQMMQNQRVSTFKTFKTNESDLKMYQDSNTDTLKYSTSERARKDEKYYQNHETDSKKAAKNKKYYAEQQQKSMQQEQMLKRHYNEQKKQQNGRHTNGNYYNDQSDDHKYVSDGNNDAQKPQLLPRTKLLKQNSVGPTMQTVMKFEQEIGLMDYRSPPRERSSGKGHHQEQMPPPGDFMPMPGTTYGPWFDLWGGRDQSVRK